MVKKNEKKNKKNKIYNMYVYTYYPRKKNRKINIFHICNNDTQSYL